MKLPLLLPSKRIDEERISILLKAMHLLRVEIPKGLDAFPFILQRDDAFLELRFPSERLAYGTADCIEIIT